MMPLYHYTDRLSLAGIRHDGLIRAQPQTLYRDVLGAHGKGPSIQTAPIVWLSSNPILEGTNLVKLTLAKLPPVGNLFRVVLPSLYAGDLGLAEYTEQVGIDHSWWTWVVRTGELAGSNYTTWRIVPADIPAADWLGVETLVGFGASGTIWRNLPKSS